MLGQLWEQLQGLGTVDTAELGILPLLIVLLVALASSVFIAYLYQVFYRARATGSEVYRSFPLMGISITAIFISVQFSLPLSLGLLGALSIVRFRTPIKEPEEIGFILLVIAASLAAATFSLTFLALILGVAVLALLLLRLRLPRLSATAGAGMLTVALPTTASGRVDEVLALLGERLPRGTVDSVTEGDGEVMVSYRFRHLEPDAVPPLVGAIKGLDDDFRSSVFFHQNADL